MGSDTARRATATDQASAGAPRWAWRCVATAALVGSVVLVAGCGPPAGRPAASSRSATTTTSSGAAATVSPAAPPPGAGPGAPTVTAGAATPSPSPSTTSTTAPATQGSTSTSAVAVPGAPGFGCSLAITVADAREGPRRTTVQTLTFANTGAAPCPLGGERPVRYISAQFVGPDRSSDIGQGATGYGGDLTLAPGESTSTTLTTSSLFGFDDDRCEPAPVGGVRIFPPADAPAVVVPAVIGEVCTNPAVGRFLEVGGLSARG